LFAPKRGVTVGDVMLSHVSGSSHLMTTFGMRPRIERTLSVVAGASGNSVVAGSVF
jgi:hypothetical protein